MPLLRLLPIMQKGKFYELSSVSKQQMYVSRELSKQIFPESLKCLIKCPCTNKSQWDPEACYRKETTEESQRQCRNVIFLFELFQSPTTFMWTCQSDKVNSKTQHVAVFRDGNMELAWGYKLHSSCPVLILGLIASISQEWAQYHRFQSTALKLHLCI